MDMPNHASTGTSNRAPATDPSGEETRESKNVMTKITAPGTIRTKYRPNVLDFLFPPNALLAFIAFHGPLSSNIIAGIVYVYHKSG